MRALQECVDAEAERIALISRCSDKTTAEQNAIDEGTFVVASAMFILNLSSSEFLERVGIGADAESEISSERKAVLARQGGVREKKTAFGVSITGESGLAAALVDRCVRSFRQSHKASHCL